MDSVRSSGVVQIHGVDDGTRVKVEDWRELRYASAGMMKSRPRAVMVRLQRPERSPQTGEVSVKYLGDRGGSVSLSSLSFLLNIFFSLQAFHWWNCVTV